MNKTVKDLDSDAAEDKRDRGSKWLSGTFNAALGDVECTAVSRRYPCWPKTATGVTPRVSSWDFRFAFGARIPIGFPPLD